MKVIIKNIAVVGGSYNIDNLQIDGEDCAVVIQGNCKGTVLYYMDNFYLDIQFKKNTELFNDHVELFNILTYFKNETNFEDNKLKTMIEKTIMAEIVRLSNDN